ncbi:helix-turn-helix domain-containing protein [Actinobacillus seminis]|uniref:helix-turn-helix domain-containing protein n=1 Tax=Actinobacillus seminis TaxID=722 RepID=UPI003B93906C
MLEINVESILERMKTVTQLKTDKDLAGYLFVKTTTFSNWKKNNSIPLEVIISFVDKNSLSMDWLMFGKKQDEQLNIDEQMLLSAYRNMDQQQKLNALTFMSGLNNNSTPTGQGNVTQSAKGNVTNMVAGNMHK